MIFDYKNITTQATTVVKIGEGKLHAIALNEPTATTTIAIYDGVDTDGTLIGTVTIPADPQPSTIIFDVAFSTGLTIVTGTADSDITVSYN